MKISIKMLNKKYVRPSKSGSESSILLKQQPDLLIKVTSNNYFQQYILKKILSASKYILWM